MTSLRVAVVGASGFVGREVCEGLRRRGAVVTAVSAPRLTTALRDAESMVAQASSVDGFDDLVAQLRGVEAVINAAGLSDAGHADSDALYGANSLLPLVIAAAAPSGVRFVHVSSAAVQGRRPVLDETPETAAFSGYSRSKALAEQGLATFLNVVIYRPTSVHGVGRAVTQRLSRFMTSPLASVAGWGDRPTPQVLVENVGDAIAYVALVNVEPPRIVLHPSEGLTTGALAAVLGGRPPRRVPLVIGRPVVNSLTWAGRRSSRLASIGRRLEMLWFGQDQVTGWLHDQAWSPVAGDERWRSLR